MNFKFLSKIQILKYRRNETVSRDKPISLESLYYRPSNYLCAKNNVNPFSPSIYNEILTFNSRINLNENWNRNKLKYYYHLITTPKFILIFHFHSVEPPAKTRNCSSLLSHSVQIVEFNFQFI